MDYGAASLNLNGKGSRGYCKPDPLKQEPIKRQCNEEMLTLRFAFLGMKFRRNKDSFQLCQVSYHNRQQVPGSGLPSSLITQQGRNTRKSRFFHWKKTIIFAYFKEKDRESCQKYIVWLLEKDIGSGESGQKYSRLKRTATFDKQGIETMLYCMKRQSI